MLTSFSLKGLLELPTKCSLGEVKLETMLASGLDCSGSVGKAQVLKLKGLMTLQGSNCWVSLHNVKCGVLHLRCLVPISSPSLFLVSVYCTLFLLIYLVGVMVLGVNATYWLPWMHCVYLLCP